MACQKDHKRVNNQQKQPESDQCKWKSEQDYNWLEGKIDQYDNSCQNKSCHEIIYMNSRQQKLS